MDEVNVKYDNVGDDKGTFESKKSIEGDCI
jgi:hypothetical protein